MLLVHFIKANITNIINDVLMQMHLPGGGASGKVKGQNVEIKLKQNKNMQC